MAAAHSMGEFDRDVVVIGGCGHVGLPLAIAFADRGAHPKQTAIPGVLEGCAEYLRDGQLLVLRSTVFPGVTALVEKMIAGLGVAIEVAFCPERIAEGKAMTELFELYLVDRLEQKFNLPSLTVGILGMAFKGGSDDIRSSLSYKLRRIIATPHQQYRDLVTGKPVADIWNMLGAGARL